MNTDETQIQKPDRLPICVNLWLVIASKKNFQPQMNTDLHGWRREALPLNPCFIRADPWPRKSVLNLQQLHQIESIVRLLEFPAMLEHTISRFLANLRRGQLEKLSFQFRILQPVLGIA